MNPLIMQQLAADHINEMIAKADDRRQARQARRARPSRTSGKGRSMACRARRPNRHEPQPVPRSLPDRPPIGPAFWLAAIWAASLP